MRATTADREQSVIYTYLVCLAAWAIPGAGHLLLGRVQKGGTFLITLTLMFVFGLWLQGRLFPIELSQPLVARKVREDPQFHLRVVGRNKPPALFRNECTAYLSSKIGSNRNVLKIGITAREPPG